MHLHTSCLLAAIASITFFGCEEDPSPVFSSFVNKTELAETHQYGDIIRIEIFALSDKGALKSLKLSTYDVQNGEQLYLDTTLAVQRTSIYYYYAIPYFDKDTIQIDLQLEAINDNGDKSNQTFPITAYGSGRKNLVEYSGLILYGGRSNRPNALELNNPTQTFDLASVDTTLTDVDIYAYAAPNDTSEALSREWRTCTNTEFVRFNDFDYAQATSISLSNLYNAAHRTNRIADITNGDKIIVGKDGQAWGVFLIVMCYDEDGVNEDGYLLNFKRIAE